MESITSSFISCLDILQTGNSSSTESNSSLKMRMFAKNRTQIDENWARNDNLKNTMPKLSSLGQTIKRPVTIHAPPNIYKLEGYRQKYKIMPP